MVVLVHHFDAIRFTFNNRKKVWQVIENKKLEFKFIADKQPSAQILWMNQEKLVYKACHHLHIFRCQRKKKDFCFVLFCFSHTHTSRKA